MNPEVAPGEATVFAAAVQWLEGTLLGTVATTIAVIAVACIGLLLLSGRIDVRRAAQVVFGCFILFGASTIASGIAQMARDSVTTPSLSPMPPVTPLRPLEPVAPPSVRAAPYDPYAGAALPARP